MTGQNQSSVKAVTLHQPWASLMALGVKRNETRSWSTPHRGPLAIHAGANLTGWGRRGTVSEVGPYTVERDASGLLLRGPGLAWPYRLPLGAVVAIVSVIDVKRTDSPELKPGDVERALGDYTPGRYAWQTGSCCPIRRPISARGYQSLWDWSPPDGVLAATEYFADLEAAS